MAADTNISGTLNLQQLVGLLKVPTLPELVRDGVDATATDYRRVVERLARHYLQQVLLDLLPVGEDLYRVQPLQGYEWNDAAYWLGHALNLRAGSVVITAPSDLLRGEEGSRYPDMGQAVLARLDLLGDLPELYGMGRAADALAKALKDLRQVRKVRGAVQGR